MSHSINLLAGKRKYLFGLITLLCISLILLAFNMSGISDFDSSRREVLLRKIGHELLLQSGDNSSRVLPVEKLGDNEYQVRFEKEFSFKPDSLITITQRLLSGNAQTSDYVVNVINCGSSSVAYGYAIANNKKDDIIACTGRTQPSGCYKINIKFKPVETGITKKGYLLAGLPVLAFIGLVFLRRGKPQKVLQNNEITTEDFIAATSQDNEAEIKEEKTQETNIFSLGSVLFDAKSRKLVIQENTIDLTETETRVLLIFATAPNQIIERSRLQKEIWEDEGVIVGRSLDMFISKLRKKLEADSNVNIVVVRSKGYRLEINSSV